MKTLIGATLAALVALGTPAFAQSGHGSHGGSGSHGGHGAHSAAPAANEPASTREYRAANDKMHADMNIPFSGDPDIDFVRGMIPHHQGAIDMARIVLKHGRNEETRALAAQIIQDQEREIAQMKAWLAKQGK